MRLLLVDASHLFAAGSGAQELQEMTGRVEQLSRAEHDLMRDVHPQVGELRGHVETINEAISHQRD